MINHEKYEFYFSFNTPRQIRRVIQGFIGMRNTKSLGIYLGLPYSIGRKKTYLFAFMEEKTRNKIQG